jgi:hypothetical protein
MTDKRELGMGDVPITLVDELGQERTVVLKPSLYAARTLSRSYGGLQQVQEKVLRLDFDVMVDVVAMGIQLPQGNPKARAELEQSVFRAGLMNAEGGLALQLTRYINNLTNGGKPSDGATGVPQANPPTAS